MQVSGEISYSARSPIRNNPLLRSLLIHISLQHFPSLTTEKKILDRIRSATVENFFISPSLRHSLSCSTWCKSCELLGNLVSLVSWCLRIYGLVILREVSQSNTLPEAWPTIFSRRTGNALCKAFEEPYYLRWISRFGSSFNRVFYSFQNSRHKGSFTPLKGAGHGT